MEPSTPTNDRPGNGAVLSRTLKQHWVWAIALGCAVGWGAFIQPTTWMADAGPMGGILGMLIGGALMVVIATSYGYLIRTFPVAGGEFAYAFAAFGRHHATLCGWFLTLGYICIVALNASALAVLGKFLFPDVVEQGFLYTIAGWDVYVGEVVIASAALLVFAWLNIRGTTLSGRIQFFFCSIMLLGVVGILLSVLISPEGQLSNVDPLWPDDTSAIPAILTIVAIAPWAYVGFDSVPQVAEEFTFSPRKALRLIVFAIAAASFIYAAMILATASGANWQELVAAQPEWGTGDIVDNLFGKFGLAVLAISASMGIFTGLNGFFVAASRLLFAMGRGRMVPGVFGKLHPKYKTPYLGIIFICAFCLITPWFGREALNWVVNMTSVGVTIAYLYTCLDAYMQARKVSAGTSTHGNAPTQIVGLLGVLACLTFLGLLLIPSSPAALGREEWIALGIWVVLGFVLYMLRFRENQRLTDEELAELILYARGDEDEPARIK